MGIAPARSLPLQHMGRAVKGQRDGLPPDAAPLGPNQMQLYSYYRPGLVAGDYEVTVTQDISATVPDGDQHVKESTLQITNVRNKVTTDGKDVLSTDPQKFEVVVPRFTINPALINSYYPPDGHQDEGRILPHIVLNDPHYPWEVDAGSTTNMSGPIDGDRNLVPWIALLVFDADDLRISTPDEITALNIPNQDTVNKQQNAKGTFSMQVKEYFNIPAGSHIDFQKGYGQDVDLWNEVKVVTDTAQVIFPKKQLFSDIFKDPESLKYLAHVRNINTEGFPDAGIEEVGLYSIIISSRTGQFDIIKPCTQICHLVSIENVDSTVDEVNTWLATAADKRTGPDRIGLFSLCSWVYTALPPDPVNFIDTVRDLVTTQQMFRSDQATLTRLNKSISLMDPSSIKAHSTNILLEKLQLGYTFARWRPETGEETAALNRGPLVPQQIQQKTTAISDLPDCSNTSKELQILDKDTGLMDLSYSSAWQLGKTLAISDTVFSAALLRFRSVLHNSTASVTRSILNNTPTKADLLQNLHKSVGEVHQMSKGATGPPERLQQSVPPKVVSDVSGTAVFKENLATNFDQRTNAGTDPFNGFNTDPANDNDWVIIHNWMADKLALSDIPPHYLIPEPSFVPPEAIRFFYIDDFWLDCLLDGALSVANHLNHDDDLVRVMIKKKFNEYLRAEVPGSGIKPQIPGYGFILRSQVVKAMPDLRITVTWSVPDPDDHKRYPVCRYTKFDDTTLICLLDRWPEELDSIVLAQPPHQQRFALGTHLTGPTAATAQSPALPGRLEVQLKRLYTSTPLPGEWKENTSQPFKAPKPEDASQDATQAWFDWNTRCMKLKPMMDNITTVLQRKTTDEGVYDDLVSNSCELGMILNDPSYFFTIHPPKMPGKMVPQPPSGTVVTPPDRVIVPRDRQLYINEIANSFTPTPAKKSAPTPQKPGDNSSKPGSTGPVAPNPGQGKKPAQPSPAPTLPLPNPPHIQPRMQPVPPSLLARRTAPSGTTPLGLFSQFKLGIHADYKPYPVDRIPAGFDPQSYIPTHNLFFFDLIFSLTKRNANSKYPLLEIQIDIPNEGLAPNHPTKDNEPLLQQNYDGPGLHMLANQRFIPFLFFDTDHMRVQLLPRTAADNYKFVLNDRKSAEVGFRLGEANIAHVRVGQSIPMVGFPGKPQWRGVSTVTLVEIYATDQGNWPVTTVVEVVKWAVRDQEDIDLGKA